MSRPLAIDLYSGLHGWAEALVLEGWRVVAFDIVDMPKELGQERMKGIELVLQDVLTLHGSQFKGADLIVASPPCQEFSYMAMPWKRAKEKIKYYEASVERRAKLTALFDACFRIQREASEAAGRYIPLVVENVRGAQKWVGRARWHFGSYYLWGDVPALMPRLVMTKTVNHLNKRDGVPYARHLTHPIECVKNFGGSWFNMAHNKGSGRGKNPVNRAEHFKGSGSGSEWFDGNLCVLSSKSNSRKAASAQIARIPFPLAQHIAKVFKPETLTSKPEPLGSGPIPPTQVAENEG